MFVHFVVFAAFAQSLRNHLSGPGTEMTQPLCVTWLFVCVCACIHSKACHLPLATAACNRPSMKARQLAISGGGGGCGMGDYARGLVSYTIAVRVSGGLQSRCIRTALCLFMRARRLQHTQRDAETEETRRGSLRSRKIRMPTLTSRVALCPTPSCQFACNLLSPPLLSPLLAPLFLVLSL